MSNKGETESAADLIIKTIQESANPDEAAETAIMAICSFLSLRGHTPQVLRSDLQVSDLSAGE